MLKKTESLAWLVLILSFFTCIALVVGIPLMTRWFLRSSTRPLLIMLEGREGTVTYQPIHSSTRVAVEKGKPAELRVRSRIQLAHDDAALLLFYHPDEPEVPIGTVQLYGTADVEIEVARTPRFGLSPLPNQIALDVRQALNMRPSLSGNGRASRLDISTPQGPISLEEGSFKLVVDADQTEIKVSTGRARVVDPVKAEALVLVPLQGARMTEKGLGEIYVGERDLLRNRNGDFEDPLDGIWEPDTYPPDNGGMVRRIPMAEENHIVYFERVGEDHGETGIRQEVNLDIRDVESLRVRAVIRIANQTLPVCGSGGSECPVMIRLEFIDRDTGGSREWLQGFYARDDSADLPFCQVCEWKAEHIKVPIESWYDYESEDLLPILEERGIHPAFIREVSVYAQGWAYSSSVDEVAILVGE